MTSITTSGWRRWLLAPTLTPWGFIVRGLCVAAVYGVCEAFGARQYTGIISGTAPSAEGDVAAGTALGVFYGLVYFAFVLLTPVLLIAGGIFWGLLRIDRRRASDKRAMP